MPAWNEVQYARAQEFARIITDLASGQVSATHPAPVLSSAATTTPRDPVVSPAARVGPEAGVPAPAAKPTAASVFNKIPWKK